MSPAPPAHFEHVAIAVHLDDLGGWDRLLRCDLGGRANMGGAVPQIGFQGGQIDYPDAGMLELLSWIEGAEEKSAMKRYVDRHGGRAALHHLTFLVEDFDASVERARGLGHEPMLGRNSRHWKEFFLREPGLRPKGFLIQVLQANKGALANQPGWSDSWEPFTREYPDASAAATIRGVEMQSANPEASARLFADLLGAEVAEADAGLSLAWRDSSMGVQLVAEGESHVVVSPPVEHREGVRAALVQGPPRSGELLRPTA